MRYAVATHPAFLMSSARFLIGGGLLYLFSRRRGAPVPGRARNPRRRHCRPADARPWQRLGRMVRARITSGLAALLVAASPLWFLLLDWLRPGGKRPTRIALVGLVIGFAGVILLLNPGGSGTGGIDRSARRSHARNAGLGGRLALQPHGDLSKLAVHGHRDRNALRRRVPAGHGHLDRGMGALSLWWGWHAAGADCPSVPRSRWRI